MININYEDAITDNINLIYKLSHSYHIDEYEFDDLVQEALTKLWEVWDEYDDTYALTTFIQTIVSNHFNNLYQKNKVQKRQNYDSRGNELDDLYLDNETYYMLDVYDSEYNFIELFTIDIAYDILNDYKYKDIVECILDGMTYRDIGDKFGISFQRVHQIWKEFIEKVDGGIK